MRVEFDNEGVLHIKSDNNMEMVALRSWVKSGEAPLIEAAAHLQSSESFDDRRM